MNENNPHAFPNITPDMQVDGGPGMSLRDYFAAKSLNGYRASDAYSAHRAETLAEWAYQDADAMLRERNR